MEKELFKKENIIRQYSGGIESSIFYYKENSKTVFLKLFKKEITFPQYTYHVPVSTFENKKNKIERISSLEIFKDDIKPLTLIYDTNNICIGYTMEISSLKTAHHLKSKKEKIAFLKKLKEKLEILNKHNIYIGDFNENNFLINDSKIELCDLDNLNVQELPCDLPSFSQINFENSEAPKNLLDVYGFNLLTISLLEKVHLPYTIFYLNGQNLGYPFKTKENNEIVKKLVKINSNFSKDYLIDHLQFPYNN